MGRSRVFDDHRSYAHTLFGLVCGALPIWGVLASSVFVFYEVIESMHNGRETFFDLIEFYVGVFLGWLVRFYILPTLLA